MNLADWLEHHFLKCPFKALTGLDCPGCGIQRAFVALLRGDIKESFFLYPALLPMLFMFLLTAVHIAFKLKEGARYIKYSYLFSIAVIVISYVLKMTG